MSKMRMLFFRRIWVNIDLLENSTANGYRLEGSIAPPPSPQDHRLTRSWITPSEEAWCEFYPSTPCACTSLSHSWLSSHHQHCTRFGRWATGSRGDQDGLLITDIKKQSFSQIDQRLKCIFGIAVSSRKNKHLRNFTCGLKQNFALSST